MDKDLLYILYGDNPKFLAEKILEEAGIIKDLPDKNSLIGIKPNLVVARPAEEGATTSPELVEGVITFLKKNKYHNIIILEGTEVGGNTSRAFKVCGYEKLSEKYNVPLINLQKDSFTSYDIKNTSIRVCDKAMKVEYLINIPVLKGHCQTRITCALKNLKGCIPDNEKKRFHTMGLHKPIAYLNKILKQHLIIVDGIIGDLNFEGGGNPVQMNRVILGKDPVLVDTYAAQLLGYDKKDISYIKIAEDIGVGTGNLAKENIIELNKDEAKTSIPGSREVKRFEAYITEDMACSSCYGSLIHALDRLKDRGFLNSIEKKYILGRAIKIKPAIK